MTPEGVAQTMGATWLVALVAGSMPAHGTPPAPTEPPAAYCARQGTDDTLRPIPASLVSEVNRLLHTSMPPEVATRMTVFRCDNGRVRVCGMGANLPCGKAETSRSSPGATAWCREHPNTDFIPAFATGHASIFDWRCAGGMAVIVRQRYQVDPLGFVARYWHSLPAAPANPANK